MGNSTSGPDSKYGHLILQLETPYAVAGNDLVGTIYLDLKESYPATSLDLIIKGKEKCQWTERKIRKYVNSRGRTVSETYGDTFRERREILNECFTISIFKAHSILPGQYSFPFRVEIPKECPSSTDFAGPDWEIAIIKYSIKAMLQSTKDDKFKPMKFKQTLMVREDPLHVERNTRANLRSQIYSWWFPQGRTSVEARLDK